MNAALPAACVDFWNTFLHQRGCLEGEAFYEAFHFHDNEAGANELATLVLAGKKRGTAGLQWWFEHDRRAAPTPGALSIVTDWAGAPLCVIKTTHTEIVAFEDVSAEFAAIEGEGDGTLAYWRRVHRAFFARSCQRIGREPSPRMPVVCEQFEVVFRR